MIQTKALLAEIMTCLKTVTNGSVLFFIEGSEDSKPGVFGSGTAWFLPLHENLMVRSAQVLYVFYKFQDAEARWAAVLDCTGDTHGTMNLQPGDNCMQICR